MKHHLFLLLLAVAPLLSKAQSARLALPCGDVFIKAGLREKETAAELIGGRYYRYLQFRAIPTEGQKAALTEKGIRLLDYLPEAAYVASLPAGLLLSDTLIRSVISIKPAWKLAAALAAKQYPKGALRGAGRIEVTVLYYGDIIGEAAAAVLTGAGFTVLQSSPQLHAHRLIVRIADLSRLAAVPAVAYIEPVPGAAQPTDLRGRTHHRANVLASEYNGGLHFDGTGVRVAINDDGLIGPHIDHTGRVFAAYTNANVGYHGDFCSGVLTAAGNLDPIARGAAPGAKLGIYIVNQTFTYYQAYDSIYSHYPSTGVRITSTSYTDFNPGYSTVAHLLDLQTTDLPELIHVISAGNYGYGGTFYSLSGGHNQAKNVIAVGNISHHDTLNNASSRGPAQDGRIKPDVCAYGTDVYSTLTSNTYASGSGTSASCPAVAGTLAVLYQAYKSLHGGANPPSSLMKAVLLNTAEDLGNPGPDFTYGFGRINARRAYGILQSGQYLFDSISQGGNRNHTIAVPAGTAELRVMLYWHDKAAVAGATKTLVNNLDATLITPASAAVQPWILNPGGANSSTLNQPAVRGIDTLNNVEQITLANPAAGNYTLHVAGFAVPQGPQKYVVVYEFVNENLVLTYPIGGEPMVGGVLETIRWDAFGDSGPFTLEYSTDNGAAWTTLATNIPATQRYYDWTPPAVATGQALVRVTRGGQSSTSAAPFTIIGVPANLTVNWICTDSFSVSYSAVPGATGYVVSLLGNEYMDSTAYSPTTTCVVHGINTNAPGWFSVHALAPNNGRGRRAIAVPYGIAPFNCVLAADMEALSISAPTTKTYMNCDGQPHPESMRITLKNNGPGTAYSAVIKYRVGSGPVVTEPLAFTPHPGDVVTQNFGLPVYIPAPSAVVTAWVEQTPDINHTNDTARTTLQYYVPAPASLSMSESFSSFTLCDTAANCEATSCPLSKGWYNATSTFDDDIDWRVHSGPTPNRAQGIPTAPLQAADAGGKYLYLQSRNCGGRRAALISPCLTVSNMDQKLRFYWHLYGNQGSLHLDLLTDGFWNEDVFVVGGEQGDSWHQQEIDLSGFNGRTVSFRFRGITGPLQSDMAIDNISVGEFLNVENSPQRAAALQVAPNPSRGSFTVTLTGAPDGEARCLLTDAAGRVVSEQILSVRNGSAATLIASGAWPAGVYILQVKGKGFSLQTKLVKM